MRFGWKTGLKGSFAILDRFVEAGGNFIQATVTCGRGGSSGMAATDLAEEHVGEWLAQSGVDRSKLVLATRIVISGDLSDDPQRFEYVRRCYENSLLHFGVDNLDLLLLEWNPALMPIRSALNLAESLSGSDRVGCVGASGFPTWRLMEAHAVAREKGWSPFAAAQNDFSPVWPHQFHTELAHFCGETGAGFIARPPTTGLQTNAAKARGRLSGRRINGVSGSGAATYERMEAVAKERGSSTAETSIAWVLANPLVSSAVVNAGSVSDLDAPIAAASRPMLAAERDFIWSGCCPPSRPMPQRATMLV